MSKTFLEALTNVGKSLQSEINQLDENVKQLGSGGNYILPEASHDTLGGIKIDGSTLIKNGDGTYSAVVPDPDPYTLPEASSTTLGGVKIDGTTIIKNSDGTYSAVAQSATVSDTQLATAISKYVASHPLSSNYPVLSVEGSTVVNVGYPYGDVRRYGAKGDGTTNDTSAINNAIACGFNDVYFPAGTYYVSNTFTAPSGMRFFGEGYETTTIKTSSTTIFDVVGKNTFEDICFNSTNSTVSMYGLLNFINRGSNTFVRACKFTSTACNAVKVIGETAKVENVIFERCNFTTLGRMGIEFQNHATSSIKYDGYNNITVRDCMFYNIGIKEYGMGISFSGWGECCTIENNRFEKMAVCGTGCGIEFVGCCSSVIRNNKFVGTTDMFQCTNARVMHDNVIEGNICAVSSSGAGRCLLRNTNRLIFKNNVCGELQLRDLSFCTFSDNTIVTAHNYGVFCDHPIRYNLFQNNYIDITKASSFYSAIRLSSSEASENVFDRFFITPKSTGSYADGYTSQNTFSNFKTTEGGTISI